MISIANSILFRYGGNGKIEEQELKYRFVDINNNKCKPPLPTTELDIIWKDAVAYSTKKRKEEGSQAATDYQYNRAVREKKKRNNLRQRIGSQQNINFVIDTIKKEAPMIKYP